MFFFISKDSALHQFVCLSHLPLFPCTPSPLPSLSQFIFKYIALFIYLSIFLFNFLTINLWISKKGQIGNSIISPGDDKFLRNAPMGNYILPPSSPRYRDNWDASFMSCSRKKSSKKTEQSLKVSLELRFQGRQPKQSF